MVAELRSGVQERYALVLLTAIVGVYLLLACCAYPTYDDWIAARNGRDDGVIASTVSYLRHWGGRWMAFFLLAMMGHLPSLTLAYPFLVLGGFALAAWSIARCWGWRMVLIAGVPLLAWLPSPAEGPYWMSGGICYLLPAVLLLLTATLPVAPWASALRVLIGAVAAGCSETAAILAAGASAVAWLMHDRRHAWTLAGVLFGGVLSLLAPGNAARWDVIAGGQRPDPLTACWVALPRSAAWLLDMLGKAWWCPVLPALTALALEATPGTVPARPARTILVIGLFAGSLLVALLATAATVGLLEGRQHNALWLHVMLGILLIAWLILRPLGPHRQRLALIVWWLLCWLQVARLDADPWLALLLLTACVISAVLFALWAWRQQCIPAVVWLALAAVAAPGLSLACHDLWRAPQRRAEQWCRDAAVIRLVAAGEAQLRIPMLDPRNFAPTISIGDLAPGHWATDGYAAWHHLRRLQVDPRITVVEPLRTGR